MAPNDAAIAISLKFVDQATAPMKASLNQMSSALDSVQSSIRGAFNLAAVAAFAIGVRSALEGMVQTGVQIQQLGLAFKGITGSQAGAAQEMAFVRSESERLGLSLLSTAEAYKGIAAASRGTSLEGRGVREIFSRITEAATVLGLRSDQVEGALYAIGQMMSKGKIQAEELRGQLGERLPGAFQIAARAMNMTTAELDKFMADGKLMADEFLPRFAQQLGAEYSGSVADSAKSATAEFNRFQNASTELKNELATGLLPIITDVTRAATELIKKAREGGEALKALEGVHHAELVVDITTNAAQAQAEIDQFLKANNVGQSVFAKRIGALGRWIGSPFEQGRNTRFWQEWEGARYGPDKLLGTQPTLQTGRFRELEAQMRFSSQKDVEAQRLGVVTKAHRDYARETSEAAKRVENLGLKSHKLADQQRDVDLAWRAGKLSADQYAQATAYLKDQWDALYKVGSHAAKGGGGGALGIDDINQSIDRFMSRATKAKDELRSLQYENQIVMREGQGRPVEAEWLRTEQAMLKGAADAWEDIYDAQVSYRELEERLAGSRGGATVEAMRQVAEAKKYLDDVWSTGLARIELIDSTELERFRQWNDEVRRSANVELAQLSVSYTELTGSIEAQVEAQIQYLRAVEARNIADAQTPEIAEAYRRLADEQERMARLKTGSFFDGFSEGARKWSQDLPTVSDMGQEAFMRVTDVITSAGDALVNFATTGKASFKDFATSVISDLARMAARMAILKIFEGIMGGIAGGFGGSSDGAPYSSMSSGFNVDFRASGGPVSAMAPYIVGERGPELFVPNASGYIHPNTTGGVSTVINVNVTGHGAGNEQTARQAARLIKEEFNKNLREQQRPGGLLNRRINV